MGETISSDLIIQEIINFININPHKINHKEQTLAELFNEYRGRLEFLLR